MTKDCSWNFVARAFFRTGRRHLKELIDRREFVCRNVPRCPKCHDVQVQVTAYVDQPAQWKCRKCKHRFEHEPKPGE